MVVIFTSSIPSLQEAVEPGVDPAPCFWHRFTASRKDRGILEALQNPGTISVEDDMPKKAKTGETRQNPVAAEASAPGTTSGRTRRPALNPSPTKKKAIPGLESRSSRTSASFPAGSPAQPSEYRAPADAPAAKRVTESTPQEVQPARKGGARKKTTATAGIGGRSSAAKARPAQEHAGAADLTLQPGGGEAIHTQETAPVDGNGHFDHVEVARLAYSYWEARGHQGGSSEDDWYRAQAELRRRRQQPKETKPRRRTRKA
jgi:hypothetical protein